LDYVWRSLDNVRLLTCETPLAATNPEIVNRGLAKISEVHSIFDAVSNAQDSICYEEPPPSIRVCFPMGVRRERELAPQVNEIVAIL
jgi:hypothetical protein